MAEIDSSFDCDLPISSDNDSEFSNGWLKLDSGTADQRDYDNESGFSEKESDISDSNIGISIATLPDMSKTHSNELSPSKTQKKSQKEMKSNIPQSASPSHLSQDQKVQAEGNNNGILLKEQLSKDEEVWLMQCPPDIPEGTLLKQCVQLDSTSYPITEFWQIGNRKFKLMVSKNVKKSNLCCLLPSQKQGDLQTVLLEAMGHIFLKEVFHEYQFPEIPVSAKEKMQFPTNLLMRHPLLGLDVQRSSKSFAVREKNSSNLQNVAENGEEVEENKKKKKKKDRNRNSDIDEINYLCDEPVSEYVCEDKTNKKQMNSSGDSNKLNLLIDENDSQMEKKKKKKKKKEISLEDDEINPQKGKRTSFIDYGAVIGFQEKDVDNPLLEENELEIKKYKKKKKKKNRERSNSMGLEEFVTSPNQKHINGGIENKRGKKRKKHSEHHASKKKSRKSLGDEHCDVLFENPHTSRTEMDCESSSSELSPNEKLIESLLFEDSSDSCI